MTASPLHAELQPAPVRSAPVDDTGLTAALGDAAGPDHGVDGAMPAAPARARAVLGRGAALLRERPWVLTLALCLVVLAVGLRGSDTPAESYRVWLFQHRGLVLWDNQWYGGHHVLGYSVIFPPLASLLGSAVVGTLSCVFTTLFLTRLIQREADGDHTLGLLWLAAAVVVDLVIGRLPFALGLTGASLAMLEVTNGRRVRVGLAAAAGSLASPLVGLLLLLVGVAWLRTRPWREVAPLGFAAAGLVAAVMFPDGGVFPFPWITLVGVLGVVAVGLVVVPSSSKVLRTGLMMYGAVAIVLFIVPSPVGGCFSRPASLLAGPVAAIVLRKHLRSLAIVALPLLIWELGPVTTAVAQQADSSANPTYYAGLQHFLTSSSARPGRLEVPFTREHWEARYLAPTMPLARGWERQLDLRYNAALYEPTLSAAQYLAWLESHGVRYVALPDAPLEEASANEVALLEAGQPYLQPVYTDKHWRVWEVKDYQGLASGAQLTHLGVDGFTLRFSAAGNANVLINYSNYWVVTSGTACVTTTLDGQTRVRSLGAGDVTVAARWSIPAMVGGSTSCSDLAHAPHSPAAGD